MEHFWPQVRESIQQTSGWSFQTPPPCWPLISPWNASLWGSKEWFAWNHELSYFFFLLICSCLAFQPHTSYCLEEGGCHGPPAKPRDQWIGHSAPSVQRAVRGCGRVRVWGHQYEGQGLAQGLGIRGVWVTLVSSIFILLVQFDD